MCARARVYTKVVLHTCIYKKVVMHQAQRENVPVGVLLLLVRFSHAQGGYRGDLPVTCTQPPQHLL